ncbi:MAG: hypothetical protein HJJLKODD_02397 [Phycisphaerae bacterium]|nr:hypothetical protein [Phycisphaerae bacterium]
MNKFTLPPFIQHWPEAKMEFEGMRGWMLKNEQGLVLIMLAEREIVIPPHVHEHEDQWGVVLAGEVDQSINGLMRTYRAGECHFVPAGVEHQTTLRAGWQGLYIFSK